MKFAIASDIHLEFGDINLKNEQNADVLLLAGDIFVGAYFFTHPSVGLRMRDFIKRISFQFPETYIIMGNHEHYNGTFENTRHILEKEFAPYPNIYLLEKQMAFIGDKVIVGATLWTDMNKEDPITLNGIKRCMNDFQLIRSGLASDAATLSVYADKYHSFTPEDSVKEHKDSLNFFKRIIDDTNNMDVIVLGHHAPSFKSVLPVYQQDRVMNGGFYSELSEFILDNPRIKLWIHGHMHSEFDYMIGDTRVICNPRGYHQRESQAARFELKYLEI